jgi:polyhydroxyalkanoate synthase subunit PhaC
MSQSKQRKPGGAGPKARDGAAPRAREGAAAAPEKKPPAPLALSVTPDAAPGADAAPQAEAITNAWLRLFERGQRVAAEAMREQMNSNGFQLPDPGVISKAFMRAGAGLMNDPEKLMAAQTAYWRGFTELCQATGQRLAGEAQAPAAPPAAAPAHGDRRFQDKAWDADPYFKFVKDAYFLGARALQDTLPKAQGLDPHTRHMVEFYTRQIVDALAPSNFVATNPKVLRETVESGGENLRHGLENYLDDVERGHGRPAIKMTQTEAFHVGENIATAPGKVIFQNELMQLLQFDASTATVFRRPLLIIPPWINKYYILDLKPANSFIRWATAQGHTVFVISWVNPDQRLAHKDFEDYMVDGPLAALDAMAAATGEREANVIGYCIGGTLLAATLAYLKAKGDARIASATFFTALVDFAEAGDLKVFIDEEQLELLHKHIEVKGYLEAKHMANVFNLLRDNDLIWSFVVNNYLLGKQPMAFDLLYWNGDSTRMPAAMHRFYLRNMYLENRLVQPGGISMKGVPIDLRAIDLPVYQISTREDHIAPWIATYSASQIYRGPYKFVLAGSGHIAGVINPPSSNKYGYWTNPELPADPQAWLAGAAQHPGSWWPDWAAWIAAHGGGQVDARTPGDGRLVPIEDAPGSYVKLQASD